MSLSAISTSGVVMGSGSIAMSGNLYVRATGVFGGIPVATVPVWSTPSEIRVTGIHDYAMTGSMIRLTTNQTGILDGIKGCTIGGININTGGPYADKLLININPSGDGSITLRHEAPESAAANRFILPGASGMHIHPYLSSSGCMVRVVYDPVASGWRASTTTQK